MLDPWTALSLAASIAQFIDFGSDIVSQTREIRERGSSVQTRHLKKIAADLKDCNASLKAQVRSRVGEEVKLTPEEKVDLQLGVPTLADSTSSQRTSTTLLLHAIPLLKK
jgi:hypothetical protein